MSDWLWEGDRQRFEWRTGVMRAGSREKKRRGEEGRGGMTLGKEVFPTKRVMAWRHAGLAPMEEHNPRGAAGQTRPI
jgi:hypothetical protein